MKSKSGNNQLNMAGLPLNCTQETGKGESMLTITVNENGPQPAPFRPPSNRTANSGVVSVGEVYILNLLGQRVHQKEELELCSTLALPPS
jgi:hypothetical protein